MSDARQLSQRLMTTMLTPIVLLLAAGAALAFQVQKLNDNAQWVDHTDAVIAATYEALKGIVDQETALRGYMLTEEQAFLGPYRQSNPTETLAQLLRLSEDNPTQTR